MLNSKSSVNGNIQIEVCAKAIECVEVEGLVELNLVSGLVELVEVGDVHAIFQLE